MQPIPFTLLYIGQNNPGSTSGMRARALQKLIPNCSIQLIDTSIPFQQTRRIFRSIGFRYKCGPFITNLNDYILCELPNSKFDLIWVDKASFIKPSTTEILRKQTKLLVHYTPDTAFFHNSSRLFEKSLTNYDCFITTKSFDIPRYPKDKTLFVPQGFDRKTHFPLFDFENKTRDVVFIGLYEASRGEVVDVLLKAGLIVTIAGKKWNTYSKLNNKNIEYLGEGLFGEDYAKVISSSHFSLGLLSKKFPELHTTRTFEIPACGTALITEKNEETTSFFKEQEVIFYNDISEIPAKIEYFKNHLAELKTLTNNGRNAVIERGFDYESILRKVLVQVSVISEQ
jgi:spore maturation protein CgeB